MEAKKIMMIIFFLVMMGLINGQPSKSKDVQRLSNQFMNKKTLCHDSICGASGILVFIIKATINKPALGCVSQGIVLGKFLMT